MVEAERVAMLPNDSTVTGSVMLEAANLTKIYGDFVAVQNANLQAYAGELFGFLGPNGAGMTTTIKLLVGLLRPTSGTLRIGDLDISKNAIKAKSLIGYVPA